jgi:hypothetical protein
MTNMVHEDLSREQRIEGSSDRAFGLVFAVLFAVIAALPLLLHASPPRWWAAGVAAAFALVAWLRPALLAGMKLGLLLGHIVSPIALGLLFYCVLTPVGWVMRVAGKDPLLLQRDGGAASYWRRREPPGPPADSMSQQF